MCNLNVIFVLLYILLLHESLCCFKSWFNFFFFFILKHFESQWCNGTTRPTDGDMANDVDITSICVTKNLMGLIHGKRDALKTLMSYTEA